MFFALSKFKYRNKDSFFKLLLLLSGDINQTLWPSHINQTSGNNEWDVFKDRGFYLIPIYIISLLPKIEEIRRITCLSNAAVNYKTPYLIQRLKSVAAIFCVLTETDAEEE